MVIEVKQQIYKHYNYGSITYHIKNIPGYSTAPLA